MDDVKYRQEWGISWRSRAKREDVEKMRRCGDAEMDGKETTRRRGAVRNNEDETASRHTHRSKRNKPTPKGNRKNDTAHSTLAKCLSHSNSRRVSALVCRMALFTVGLYMRLPTTRGSSSHRSFSPWSVARTERLHDSLRYSSARSTGVTLAKRLGFQYCALLCEHI